MSSDIGPDSTGKSSSHRKLGWPDSRGVLCYTDLGTWLQETAGFPSHQEEVGATERRGDFLSCQVAPFVKKRKMISLKKEEQVLA